MTWFEFEMGVEDDDAPTVPLDTDAGYLESDDNDETIENYKATGML